MSKFISMIAVATISFALGSTATFAQSAPPASNATGAAASGFHKESKNYTDWAKKMHFAEAVTVTGPAKMIYISGIGAEDEAGPAGNIRSKDDFMGQCEYAFEKIKRILAAEGANMGDVVKMVQYITDIRDHAANAKCRATAFAGSPLPATTVLNISQLAWPGMRLEIDITAAVPLSK